MAEQRTDQAEVFIERFAGVPLTAECVYYSPQYLDKSGPEEVADFLIILKGEAILVSMKSQEDPTTRSGDKLSRWTLKAAKKAVRQVQGALRTIERERFWCHHKRRGRVDFEPSSIKVIHAIVITELFGEPVELPDDLPLKIGEVPVTYLSVNDFCNLVEELRTFRDLSVYLNARRNLPVKTLRMVGAERPLYEYFIINEQSFAECRGYEDARIAAAASGSALEQYIYFKPVRDRFANVIECVSDRLAARLDNYAEGLDPRIVAFFDDSANRKNYLQMQEELCDLRLPERHVLGMQFLTAMEKVRWSNKTEDMCYGAGWVDSKPDFIYVFISSKGVNRVELLGRLLILLRAGLAAYGKTGGMAIADRDGKHFEIQLISRFTPNQKDIELGEEYFSHLKTSHLQMKVIG